MLLVNYLNKYKFIHEMQSSFRQKHSCQNALVKLIDQWISCIDKGDCVGSLFIDFRNAFDVVDYSILLKKLTISKFGYESVQWFGSYLSVCKQASNNGKGLRDGPILFSLFINDLPFFTKFYFLTFMKQRFTRTVTNCQLFNITYRLIVTSPKTWGSLMAYRFYYYKNLHGGRYTARITRLTSTEFEN